MFKELKQFLAFMKPAFSRQATYGWFVIVFVGFLVRTDRLGVSSIVRALMLAPESYTCLLHFFHSTAWTVEGLTAAWWEWLVARDVAHRLGDRLVLVGDHTKTPKDGRKMPAVTTLHQDSETSAKPSFFRGHHWGCIGMLVQACDKFFSIPLWANIQEGLGKIADAKDAKRPKTIRIVHMAQRVARAMESPACLVLDAYFSVGPVFQAAARELCAGENLVHILTRAKKNVVAYLPAPSPKKRQRGRPRKYGKKLKLMKLFDSTAKAYPFQTARLRVYHQQERVRYLALNLLWKPTKGMLRFILVESSRGRMILISSDLTIAPRTAIELYCRRVTIETLFDTLKNTLGAMGYHFWSQYLDPASRRPKKNDETRRRSEDIDKTRNTLVAIEKFVNVQLLVLGTLQLIAKTYPTQVKAKANCWLRTVSANTPSEFVTRIALSKIIKSKLYGFGKDWITQLIRRKQNCPPGTRVYEDAA
jgi:hypothetical protein